MNYLLDGLHEDLNRIQKKPYVESLESNGRPDELVAREAWRRFLQRNDSLMVDNCFGQLRSRVTCACCQYVSTTFDSYNSISLPIPVKNAIAIEFTVCLLPLGTKPVTLTMDIDPRLCVGDAKRLLLEKLLPVMSVRGGGMHVCMKGKHYGTITKTLEDKIPVRGKRNFFLSLSLI